MIIKTLEELEQYRHLTVKDDVNPKSGPKAARAYSGLLETEELVRMLYGENLIYYVVRGCQIENKSLNRLSAELGLHPKFLARKMHEIGVPMLTKQEALKRDVELGLGVHGLSHDELVEIGKVAGRRSYESGNGIHGLSPEDRRKYGSLGGRRSYESGKGLGSLSHDELVEIGKVAGRRSYELGVGIHGLSHDERVEIGKVSGSLGGRKSYELGLGAHGLSHDELVELGRKSYESGKGLGSLSHDELVELGRKSYESGMGIHDTCKRNDYLPTIHGRRIDVPYDAKSAYEANLYRLLTYLGFQIEHDVPIELRVDEPRKEIFKSASTTFVVDFKAVSQNGAEYWYEICAHPYEDPNGLEKILMFNEQYPDRKMIVVTDRLFDSTDFPIAVKSYGNLENAFASVINHSPRFAGWERKGYNLKTHPEVFAPRD